MQGIFLIWKLERFLPNQERRRLVLAEADSIIPIMMATGAWDDVIEFTVIPAITAEEGIEFAKQMTQE